ncbi:SOS response-associated peptidase [Moheibacter lacus]|uniref:Abasic site processing protein n=1 Tax=Moheibacter lacus TaxID=2745851 RepID=A0A838ZRN6_9FLAO|nr:SOS response-associated peptidase family protein [Moheibacter lacus]MBA5629133.1 SOS response-associated peptidase [Moheibacter lacus]
MCFHTKLTKKPRAIEHHFQAKFEAPELFSPEEHINGFTFPKTPVISNWDPSKILMMNWGLLPEWATEDWNRTFTLNAKWETISEKPAFRDYIQNRCLIIVDGFYEWQQRGKEKVKYEIGFDDEIFALAGIFNRNTYSVVTTEAKGIMREIHNTKQRMPIALKTREEMENWMENKEIQPRFDFTTKSEGPIQTSLF